MNRFQSLVLSALCMLAACGPVQDEPDYHALSLEPASGQLEGGTLVLVRGAGFRESAAVLFGGILAPEVRWRSDQELLVVTPPGSGSVDIAVLHGPRTHAASSGAFTYEGESQVDLHSVRPSAVPSAGGATVVVRGAGFDATSRVFFAGTPSPEVEFVSPLVLRAQAPAGSVGPATITVQTGPDSDSLLDAFSYTDGGLVLRDVQPAEGYVGGGDALNLHGFGFTPRTQVFLGRTTAPAVVFHSPQWLEVTTPQGVAGVVDVHLADGARSTTLPSGFSYSGEPLNILQVQPDAGAVGGGADVQVYGAGFGADSRVFFGRNEASEVEVLSHRHLVAGTPAAAPGTVDIKVVSAGAAATLQGGWTYADGVGGSGPDERPYVTQVQSRSPTRISIAFSGAMDSSARDPANYSIRGDGSPASTLRILRLSDRSQSSSNQWLYFDTTEQDAQTYTLSAHGLTTTSGVPMAAPEIAADGTIVRYNQATFWGERSESPTDSDNDGIYDADEQTGYTIRITASDGSVSESVVTSDINDADTDDDGVGDADEYVEGTNPRNADTDGDGIGDFDELNRLQADATNQDSDGDGLNDPTERFYGTSVVLTDTDGDQFSDYEEILERLRNPRVADLPEPVIDVGGINLAVDYRYTYTDASGTEQTSTQSTETSLESAAESAFTRTSSRTITEFAEFGADFSACVGADCSDTMGNFAVFGGSVSARAGTSRDYNFSTESSSATASTSAYNDAIALGRTLTQSSDVTREVAGASVSVAVSFRSEGSVSFTLRNVELSLLIYDPANPARVIPVAALLPATDGLEVTLGPLFEHRGPFVFQNREIFPEQVEQLLRNPSTAFVRVANYDVVDEDGRNLSFVSQRVTELTGSVIIDFGDGRVERHDISAHSEFDPDTGRQLGLRLTDALEVAGLRGAGGCTVACGADTTDSADCPPHRSSCVGGVCLTACEADSQCPSGTFCLQNACRATCERSEECGGNACDTVTGVESSGRVCSNDYIACESRPGGARFGTQVVGDRLRLRFVRDVVASPLGSEDELDGDNPELAVYPNQRKSWIVVDGTGGYDPKTEAFLPTDDIGEMYIRPGSTILLVYTEDRDGDGLWAFEEAAHGSLDIEQDSDGDGISDDREVRGWLPDSRVLDLGDAAEPVQCPKPSEPGALPMRADCRWRVTTDIAFGGYQVRSSPVRSDTDNDGLTDAQEAAYRYTDSDGQQYGITPTDPFRVDTDEDGISDAEERMQASHRLRYADQQTVEYTTSAVKWDTDGDGLSDGLERLIRLNPVVADAEHFRDTDRDGLPEALEVGGWNICVDGARRPDPQGGWRCTGGGTTRRVFSDDRDPDRDDDGLSDYVEFRLGSDPNNADTDGDAINDIDEWNHVTLRDTFARTCELLPGCRVPDPQDSMLYGTDFWRSDTDGDQVSDGREVVLGWPVSLLGAGRNGVVPSRTVYSDPLVVDTDGDGLADGEELNYVGGALDPSSQDTDADGLSDAQERFKLDSFGRARHPLRPDSRVSISLVALDATAADDWVGWRLHSSVQLTRGEYTIHTGNEFIDAVRDEGESVRGGCYRPDSPPGQIDYLYFDEPGHVVTRFDDHDLSILLTLGYDESAVIASQLRTTLRSRSTFCYYRARHLWFGGEGHTPDEHLITGAIAEPMTVSFNQTAFRPTCVDGVENEAENQNDGRVYCRFNGTLVYRVQPFTGDRPVEQDIRLTDPTTGLPQAELGRPGVLEFYDGDRWGAVCNKPSFNAYTRACRELFGFGHFGRAATATVNDDIRFTMSGVDCSNDAIGITDCDFDYGLNEDLRPLVDPSCNSADDAVILECNP